MALSLGCAVCTAAARSPWRGSSTLSASKKLRDTFTGRKRVVHLLPVLFTELATLGATLPERLYRRGLPQALLSSSKQPGFYREWLDSFFARDIQRRFGFRDVVRFNTFFEYVLRCSSTGRGTCPT